MLNTWRAKCCHGCEKRFVGCHSQCQTYVVEKTIHTYKRDKASRERDLSFNETHYQNLQIGNMKRNDGFKRKTYYGV